MINQQHSITPPPELVGQWVANDWFPMVTGNSDSLTITRDRLKSVIDQAAQWGADQELEACHCEVSFWGGKGMADRLQATRRPKPPSLKEQALAALITVGACESIDKVTFETLRIAVEAMPND